MKNPLQHWNVFTWWLFYSLFIGHLDARHIVNTNTKLLTTLFFYKMMIIVILCRFSTELALLDGGVGYYYTSHHYFLHYAYFWFCENLCWLFKSHSYLLGVVYQQLGCSNTCLIGGWHSIHKHRFVNSKKVGKKYDREGLYHHFWSNLSELLAGAMLIIFQSQGSNP